VICAFSFAAKYEKKTSISDKKKLFREIYHKQTESGKSFAKISVECFVNMVKKKFKVKCWLVGVLHSRLVRLENCSS